MAEAGIVDFQLAEIAAACGVMVVISCFLVSGVLIARYYLK